MAEDQNPDDDAFDSEEGALDDLGDLDFDDVAGDAAGGDAAAASGLGDELDLGEDELDSLIDPVVAEQTAAPGVPTPAVAGLDSAGGEILAALAGDGLPHVMEFSTRLAEVLQVGLESVTGQTSGLNSAELDATTYEAVAETFAGVSHVALQLKLEFADGEREAMVVVMPLADAGALVRLETDADELADVDFRDRQLDAVATAVRELLDLMSLALFTDSLMGAELTLHDIRLDSAEEMLGAATAEAGPEAIRLDVTIDVPDGPQARLTLVMAPGLVARFAQALARTPVAAAPAAHLEPAPQATAPAPPAATLGDVPSGRAFEAGNVSPIRPPAGGRPADDVDVHPVRFPTIGDAQIAPRAPRSLELLMDVEMRVSVELGRSSMSVEEILSLGPGSVVELNKLAGEPVDILVNDHLIARGEVVVVDENFGVRVTEIVSAHKRVHVLAR